MLRKIVLTIKSIKNLHLFVLEFLGLIKNKDLIYNLRNNVKMLVRAGSSDTPELIIINGNLEYPKEFFPSKERPVVLDVGANIGAFSIYVSQTLGQLYPQIYSIEPSTENYKYLVRNINLNNFNNIKPFNMALSDRSGFGNLNISKGFDSFFLEENSGKSNDETEGVATKTLEDFCIDNKIDFIDLLKIDIEGGGIRRF